MSGSKTLYIYVSEASWRPALTKAGASGWSQVHVSSTVFRHSRTQENAWLYCVPSEQLKLYVNGILTSYCMYKQSCWIALKIARRVYM